MKNKKRIIVIVMCILSAIVLGLIVKINLENNIKKKIAEEIIEKAVAAGLENVNIVFKGKDRGLDCYKAVVDCSNMDELSVNEMFALDNELSKNYEVFVIGYTSKGDEYDIYPSTKSIYINGEQIYDDYFNSETHKEAVKNEVPNSYSGLYDAKLRYSGVKGVLICTSEDAMERYMTALNNGNEGTINELFSNGMCAYTEQGTKCNIVDKKLTKCKVKLLDGSYAGNTVWVIIEALQEE